MIAHVWRGQAETCNTGPRSASGTDSAGVVQTPTYNDSPSFAGSAPPEARRHYSRRHRFGAGIRRGARPAG